MFSSTQGQKKSPRPQTRTQYIGIERGNVGLEWKRDSDWHSVKLWAYCSQKKKRIGHTVKFFGVYLQTREETEG